MSYKNRAKPVDEEAFVYFCKSLERRGAMSKNIVLAGCVILDQDNRVLLLHRQTAAIDHWEVPGGKKEKGESPKTTVTREAREELGLDVQIVRSIGVANFRYEDTDMVYHYFLCSTNGTPIVGEPETFSEFCLCVSTVYRPTIV